MLFAVYKFAECNSIGSRLIEYCTLYLNNMNDVFNIDKMLKYLLLFLNKN